MTEDLRNVGSILILPQFAETLFLPAGVSGNDPEKRLRIVKNEDLMTFKGNDRSPAPSGDPAPSIIV